MPNVLEKLKCRYFFLERHTFICTYCTYNNTHITASCESGEQIFRRGTTQIQETIFFRQEKEIQCFCREWNIMFYVCLRINVTDKMEEWLMLIIVASKGNKCLFQTLFVLCLSFFSVLFALLFVWPTDPCLIPAVFPALCLYSVSFPKDCPGCRRPTGARWCIFDERVPGTLWRVSARAGQ